jgi:hypothetical protein
MRPILTTSAISSLSSQMAWGSISLHVEITGIRGEEEQEMGPGWPEKAVVKRTSASSLTPLYAEAYLDAWTVSDLRPLRSQFDTLDHVDRELERLIFGYDVLVLVPDVTAAAPID